MTFIQRPLFPVRSSLLGIGLAALLIGCVSQSGDALARLATRAAEAGEWSHAAKNWNDVLRMRGEGDMEATLGYAKALHEMGQSPLARLVLERAMILVPREEQGHFWMSIAAIEGDLGLTTPQITAYESAIQSSPEWVRARVNLGNARRLAGQSGLALAQYERAAAIDPTCLEAYEHGMPLARELRLPLVEYRLLRGRLEIEPVPTEMILRAVDLSYHPRVVYHHEDAAEIRKRWLEVAILQSPQSQRAHYLLGLHHFDSGDAKTADPLLTRAAELDPSDADALDALIRCLRATGQDSRASGVLDHAFRVVPESEHDRFRSLTVE